MGLDEGKKYTFCTIKPDSEASDYRMNELGAGEPSKQVLKGSLNHLQCVQGPNTKVRPKFVVLNDVVPKAALINVDDKVMFFSPYATATRTPSWWIIEARSGSPFFDTLKAEMEHYLAKADVYGEDGQMGRVGTTPRQNRTDANL